MQREVLEFARGERNVLVRKVYLQKFFDEVRAADRAACSSARTSSSSIDLQDKGTARFDEGKILRVVHNLARNAIEAMANQGGGRFTIRVRARTKAKTTKTLVITFTDTGPGIPKEIEHRLFRSFVTREQEGRHGPRPRHREEDRRGPRRHRHRALDQTRRDVRAPPPAKDT